MPSTLCWTAVLCAGHEQHGRCTPSALCAAVPARLLSQPHCSQLRNAEGVSVQHTLPSRSHRRFHRRHRGQDTHTHIEEGVDYRVVGGNVEQQCIPDPFSVSVLVCRPPVASKDGETLSGEGGSAVTRPPAIGVSACVPADPPCVSVHECLPSAASKDGETSGGDGGCTARALTAIGVYPSTSAAVRGLDAEIAPLHQKLYRERGECDEREAGVRGEQWHQEAVKRAVAAAGWHFKTLPINPTQPACVDLKAALASGSYLAVGVTNNQWYKGRKKQPLKYPDWPADAPAMDGHDRLGALHCNRRWARLRLPDAPAALRIVARIEQPAAAPQGIHAYHPESVEAPSVLS
jgi:hypothetical protein